jgi:hypothetical protein
MKDKVYSRKQLFLNSSPDSGASYHRSIQFNQVLSYSVILLLPSACAAQVIIKKIQ